MIRALISALLFSTPALGQDAPEIWARLPEPVTNNAVAGVELDGRMMAYSFAGLHAGKTWRDVTADASACDLTARECREIDPLPDGIGRLAAVAVTVREQIYIFGGYTVAEDHSERSTPEVWRFDPASETYTHITDMPVPVDDTVALPFQDRYIYLVSGWHDTDNVDLVQVYDVEEDRWFEATPFPGAPVFGHAGGITQTGEIMICGGTRVLPPSAPTGRRSFRATDACWEGRLGRGPSSIEWIYKWNYPLEFNFERPGFDYRDASTADPERVHTPIYRAAGLSIGDHILFYGGSNNAYNYNGIGYNDQPSVPLALARIWHGCGGPKDFSLAEFDINPGVMDLRGGVHFGEDVYLLGGMGSEQMVLDAVHRLRFIPAIPELPLDMTCIPGAE